MLYTFFVPKMELSLAKCQQQIGFVLRKYKKLQKKVDRNQKKYQDIKITATIGKKLQENVDFVNKVTKI